MMDPFLVDLVSHLFVKATIILAAAWGAARFLAHSSAAKRHAIWSLAMALLLLVPVVSPMMPAWNVDLIPGMTPASESPSNLEATSHLPLHEVPVRSVEEAVAEEESAPRVSTSATSAPSTSASQQGWTSLWTVLSWSDVALWTWAIGALWLLLQIALGLIWATRAERRSTALRDPARLKMIGRLTRELGVGRRVSVVYAPQVQVPMVWRLLRPTILIPTEARSWPDERVRAVLLHELAHVKRGDYPTHLLKLCVQALFWPNPLVWLAARRARQEQEQACDDVVLKAGVTSHEYAEHLFDVIRSFQGKGSPSLEGAVSMGRQSSLKERMRVLLSDQVDRSPVGVRTGLAVTIAGGLLALPVTALSLGAGSSETIAADFDYVSIQAEDGTLSGDVRVTGEVSGEDRYVEVTGQTKNLETPPGEPSSTYTFRVPREGTYVIWGRAFSPNGRSNSLWVRVDEGRWIRWNSIGETGQWSWDDVHDWDQNKEAVSFELSKGEHTLEVARREAGVRLDKMIVTSNWNYRPEGTQPAPPSEEVERVWLEAEKGWLQAPMKVQSDRHAAGWKYVASDEESSRDEVPSGGRALYDFDVSAADTFYVWGRVLATDGNHDSFWVRADGGDWVRWNNLRTGGTWRWQRLHDSNRDGRMVSFELGEGRHTLEVAYREEEAKLDKLLVVDDESYLPRGRGTDPGRTPYQQYLEPDAGRLQAPMQAARDTSALGGAYVVVPDGNDNSTGGSGYAEMPFAVPETGEYVIYGRVRAPNSSDNSFYISVDGGEEVAWHTPGPDSETTSEEWTWDLVSSGEGDEMRDPHVFQLEEGEHVLRIRNREDAAELDEVVVTNEAGLRGAEITVTGM